MAANANLHKAKHLYIRAFSEAQKRRAYEKQGHKCPFCVKNGIKDEYDFEAMQGDHIIPWSQGGRTVDDTHHIVITAGHGLIISPI